MSAPSSFSRFSRRFSAIASARAFFAIAAVWLAALAGVRPLILPDEGRYAGVVWEMFASGRWHVPLLDGMPFFHKPPLFYWLDILAYEFFGVHVLSARFASLFGATLLAFGLYLFLRRYREARTATVVACILLTQPFFFIGAQFANLDMLVAGMIGLTILCGADALLRRERGLPYRRPLAGAFALMALGVLAKGLIGLVLPGGVLFLWLLWRRAWRLLPALFWLPGWGLFLLLALPWFVWMQAIHPGFFDYFVIHHHFQRFSEVGFNNQMPFWFYVPVILLCTLPWSPWLLRLVRREGRREDEGDGVRSLMAIWLTVVLVFFSLPNSKLVGYVLPALPPVAFFIGEAFVGWMARNAERGRRGYAATLLLAAFLCVAIVIGARFADTRSIEPLARQALPTFQADERIVMLGQRYPYDLAFYLKATLPAWVVARWSAPEVRQYDDWPRELIEAADFAPALGKELLVEPDDLERRLCDEPGVVWLWGGKEAQSLWPALAGLRPWATNREEGLWRLTPETIRALPSCAGTPTGG